MTRRTEYQALAEQAERIDRIADAARRAGCNPFHDHDDLAPARPLVWLVLAYACLIAAFALIFFGAAAQAAELRGIAMVGAWHSRSQYWCDAPPDQTSAPASALRRDLGAPLPPAPPPPSGQYRDYESLTPGAGLGLDLADHPVMLAAGVWRTSHGEVAPFALVDWRPLRWSGAHASASLGLFAGVSGGYCRDGDPSTAMALGGATLRVDIDRVAIHLLAVPPTNFKPFTVGLALSVAIP